MLGNLSELPCSSIGDTRRELPHKNWKRVCVAGSEKRVEAPECRCLWFSNQSETRAIVVELLSLPLLRGWRRACRGEEEESTWWEEHLGRPVLPNRLPRGRDPTYLYQVGVWGLEHLFYRVKVVVVSTEGIKCSKLLPPKRTSTRVKFDTNE